MTTWAPKAAKGIVYRREYGNPAHALRVGSVAGGRRTLSEIDADRLRVGAEYHNAYEQADAVRLYARLSELDEEYRTAMAAELGADPT